MSMTLEPLASPNEDTAASQINNPGRAAEATEKDSMPLEGSDAGNDPLSIQQVNEPTHVIPDRTRRLQRLVWNVDPLFFIVGLVSLLVLSGFLIAIYRHHDLNIKEYQKILLRENAALETRLNAVSEIDEAEQDSTAIVQVASNHVLSKPDPRTGTEQSNTKPDVASVTGSLNPEIEALQALLAERDEQIDFLAAENHELRLSLEFGSSAQASAKYLTAGAARDNESSEPESKQGKVPQYRSENAVVTIEASVPFADPPRDRLAADIKQINATAALRLADTELNDLIGGGYQAYLAGDFLVARDFYNKAVQRDPYNRDANLGSAAVAIELLQYKLANDRYRHLLMLDPDDTTAFTSLLKLSPHVNGIEQELQAHINQSSEKPAVLYAILGRHYSHNSKWQLASEMFASAISEQPQPDYFYNLAVCLDHLGRKTQAVENYTQALSTVGTVGFDRAVVERRVLVLGG